MALLNPTTPTITAPFLLDAEIQKLQLALAAGLSWLTKSFARARMQTKKVNDLEVLFPEVYQGAGLDYYNCLPNDTIKAMCFWFCPESESLDYLKNKFHTRQCQLIFFVDMKQIDPSKDYIILEELKQQVLNVLSANMTSQSTIDAYYDHADQVYNAFTASYIDARFYKKKYGFMRFDVTLRYRNHNCL